MSLYGRWISADIASGQTSTDVIDLQTDYEFIQIILPTLTPCKLKVQVSDLPSGTFQDLGQGVVTEETTGGKTSVWRIGGFQFVKIVSSAPQAAKRTIKLRGMRV
jgi:hypothetical protein